MFINLDKKEYVDVPRDFEYNPQSLIVLYLMKYAWRGDRVACIGDPESMWERAYEEYDDITREVTVEYADNLRDYGYIEEGK